MDAALGEAAEDASPIKIGERALAEARERLVSARKTRDALLEEAAAASRESEETKEKIDKCVRAVLASECSDVIAELISEGTALREQLRGKIAALYWIKNHAFESWPPDAVRESITAFLNTAISVPWTENGPNVTPWVAALKGLATDADTVLPV